MSNNNLNYHYKRNRKRICIKDLNLDYLFCNGPYASDLGVEPKEIIGKNDYFFYPEEIARRYNRDDREVILKNRLFCFIEKYSVNGTECWAHITREPFSDGKDNPAGVLIVIDDITNEIIVEEILKSRINYHQHLHESGVFGTWEWNIATDKIHWSENIESILKVNKNEFDRTNGAYRSLIHPDDLEKVERTIQQTIETGGQYEVLLRIVTSGHGIQWIHNIGRMTNNSIGKSDRIFGIVRNVTSQINTETQLKLYKKAFEKARAGLFFADTSGRITNVNEAVLIFWSEEKIENILGRNISSLLKDQDEFEKILSAVTKSGYWRGELLAKRMDGTLFDARLVVVTINDDNGGNSNIVGVFMDISEEKKMIARLTKEAERFDALLRTTQDAFWVVDTDGFILDCNEATRDVIGYTREEIKGKHLSEVEVMESPEETRERIQRTMREGYGLFETGLRAKNGEVLDIEVSNSYWESEGLFLGFVKNITEQKRAYKELERAKVELEELNTALRIVLKTKEDDFVKSEKSRTSSIQKVILPLLDRLSRTGTENQIEIIEIIKNSLRELQSLPEELNANLTSREMQIAQMIHQGYTSKEIGEVLGMSGRTVENYRQIIRKKINIKNTSQSLKNALSQYFS